MELQLKLFILLVRYRYKMHVLHEMRDLISICCTSLSRSLSSHDDKSLCCVCVFVYLSQALAIAFLAFSLFAFSLFSHRIPLSLPHMRTTMCVCEAISFCCLVSLKALFSSSSSLLIISKVSSLVAAASCDNTLTSSCLE
jgi:hypothetical protein